VQVNQRIQTALDLLSASRTASRIGRTVFHTTENGREGLLQWQDEDHATDQLKEIEAGPWESFKSLEPDRQARLSGIGLLESIASEHSKERRTINEHLASFLRANSPASSAVDFDEMVSLEEKVQIQSPNDFANLVVDWRRSLSIPADIQAAISLVGKSEAIDDLRGLDLRRINLQGAELKQLNLQKINFEETRMEGANFIEARMEGAIFIEARMVGAILYGARMAEANLSHARMGWANLRHARMEGAILAEAGMEGVSLILARLERADLRHARMEGANLGGARMEGANLRGAHLEGAILSGVQMEGADLFDVEMDKRTDFRPETLRGAGLKSVDLTIPTTNTAFHEAFGDGSVTLPDHLTAGEGQLEHWEPDILKGSEFEKRWRAWQREIGYLPPDA